MAAQTPRNVLIVLGSLLCVTTCSYFFFIPPSLRHGSHGLHATVGMWGPHDSDFNWCEADYVWTPFVAEFWNTVTSALYLLAAGLGVWLHAPVLPFFPVLRFILAGVGLTGVGSMLFHASLNYRTQLADELPMYWLILAASMALYNRGQPPRTGLGVFLALWWVLVAGAMLLVPRVSLVHSAVRGVMSCSFSAMFLYVFYAGATVSTESVSALKGQTQKGMFTSNPSHPSVAVDAENVAVLFPAGFGLIVVGVVCWLLDNFFCVLLRALPVYPQLHALGWHVGTCVGLWCMYELLLVHYILILGHRVRNSQGNVVPVGLSMRYVLGVPFVLVHPAFSPLKNKAE